MSLLSPQVQQISYFPLAVSDDAGVIQDFSMFVSFGLFY